MVANSIVGVVSVHGIIIYIGMNVSGPGFKICSFYLAFSLLFFVFFFKGKIGFGLVVFPLSRLKNGNRLSLENASTVYEWENCFT